jgi:hypothetical protein
LTPWLIVIVRTISHTRSTDQPFDMFYSPRKPTNIAEIVCDSSNQLTPTYKELQGINQLQQSNGGFATSARRHAFPPDI